MDEYERLNLLLTRLKAQKMYAEEEHVEGLMRDLLYQELATELAPNASSVATFGPAPKQSPSGSMSQEEIGRLTRAAIMEAFKSTKYTLQLTLRWPTPSMRTMETGFTGEAPEVAMDSTEPKLSGANGCWICGRRGNLGSTTCDAPDCPGVGSWLHD